MKPRYLGPLIIVSWNKGGTYIICKLDSSVLHHPIAMFWVLPYFAQKSTELPDGFIDINPQCLWQMEDMDLPEKQDYIEVQDKEQEPNEDEPDMDKEYFE